MRSAAEVKKIMAVLDKPLSQVFHVVSTMRTPWSLLVATILSAQCTDERVNQVTKSPFSRSTVGWKTFAGAPLEELEDDIRSTGFFRNKAKAIKGLAQSLVEKHNGEVPACLEELVKLPGVGRKTANVVLATAFGIPGITVDTHVGRISQRLGLTDNKDPVKIEFDLMEEIPKEKWDRFSLQLIALGRDICQARKPECPRCPLLKLCPYGSSLAKSKS